jgi:phage terminase large subunit
MAEALRVLIPYRPRPIFMPWHQRTQRWSATVAHRRAGKTVCRINGLLKAALTLNKAEPRFAYLAPTFTQAKDIAWAYLKHFSANIPGAESNESELRVDLPNGGRVRLYGAENYSRIRGIYLDGIVIDEPAEIDPRAWPEVIRPALSDRKGWADFIGTPKGRNHFYDLCYGDTEGRSPGAANDPDWFFSIHRASETGILDDAELADARKTMSPEQYAQEYECSFTAAIVGAYFGKEMSDADLEGRITRVPHDPGLLVQTWWDLGYDDCTAIWFVQYAGREIRVIDYIEESGGDAAYFAKKLGERRYNYGDCILPHDAGSHSAIVGKSYANILDSLGYRKQVVVPRTDDLIGSINQARLLIPRCIFDATKCKRGIEALRQYRREWDDKQKTFKARPLHDWASHGADAFRQGAMHADAPRQARKAKFAGEGSWMG